MAKLWIDDIRDPPDISWDVARTADEATRFLVLHWHKLEEISFDHDLGETSKTGYDILDWIEHRIHDGHLLNARLQIHSANPVGRKNMDAAIKAIERYQK